MVNISRVYVRSTAEPSRTSDLRELAESTFRAVEAAEIGLLRLHARGSRVEVREGSTEVVALITASAAAIGSIVTAIGTYDGFWAGINRLRDQAKSAGAFIRTRLAKNGHLRRGQIVMARVTTGHLTSLDRLHRSFQNGDLTADEAVQKALRLLVESEEDADANLIRSLEKAFRAPKVGIRRLDRLELEVSKRSLRLVDHSELVAKRSLRQSPESVRPRRVVIERLPESPLKLVAFDE